MAKIDVVVPCYNYGRFRSGIGCLRRGRFDSGFPLLRWAMDLDPQLRYFAPLWQFLKFPGSEGRRWALSAMRETSGKLFRLTSRSSGIPLSQNPSAASNESGPYKQIGLRRD